MVKVSLPRASWDEVILCLEALSKQGFYTKATMMEIIDQVDKQEY